MFFGECSAILAVPCKEVNRFAIFCCAKQAIAGLTV